MNANGPSDDPAGRLFLVRVRPLVVQLRVACQVPLQRSPVIKPLQRPEPELPTSRPPPEACEAPTETATATPPARFTEPDTRPPPAEETRPAVTWKGTL